MPDKLLDFVAVDPNGTADTTVIWLHGLGADGHDFEPIVPQLHLPADHRIRFVFPHAPSRSVTINDGYVMPAWFDITSLERLNGVNQDQVEESTAQVNTLIEHEIARGASPHRIVIAGFSQGGVVALYTAVRATQPLAGVIALSTYLPGFDTLQNAISGAHKQIPVFMAHGAYDPVVPITLGRMSYDLVKSLFPDSQWHEYAMEHCVCMEEIQMLSQWLKKVLGIN